MPHSTITGAPERDATPAAGRGGRSQQPDAAGSPGQDAAAGGKRSWRRGLAWTAAGLAAVIAVTALFLAWFDWDKARGPIASFASARIHRTVKIDGHLRVHLLTWSPTATVQGLRIGQPKWAASRGDMLTLNSATVSIRLPMLLKGQVVLPLVRLDAPRIDLIRDSQGRTNWNFNGNRQTGPAKVPPIQQFIINDGRLRYADARAKLLVDGVIEARESRSGAYTQGFHLEGKGSVNSNPFLITVTGGPMINIDRNRPYPFDADMRGGATRILAKGQITRPFDFGGITAAVNISGPDLNDLYLLTRLTLPNTPPYRLSGKVVRDGTLIKITGIRGKVGDTDLNGSMSVQTKGRLTLTADLTSRMLDLDDLMAVLGGAPDARETASPSQVAMSRAMAAQKRLLPNATLQIDRLRAMDAVVKYRAATARSPTLPVRSAALDLKLDHGVLNLDPFRFKLTRGDVTGKARIDGRNAVPITDFDARLSGVGIEQFMKSSGAPPAEGLIQARARLHGVGTSVHQAASNARGDITIVVPRGKIRQAFAELLGINAGKGLYLLLSNDPRETDLRCAVANFKVTNGVARTDHLVIDTGVVTATGSGTVNLKTEQMNLVVEGKTKKARLLRVWAPITFTGPLSAPQIGVQPQKAIAQAGVAAALGAILTPLAAILPFVDPGLAKDADCAGLIAQANSQGAPVKLPSARSAAR